MNTLKRGQIIVDGQKICSKCKQLLPINQFWKAKLMSSGYHSSCKECKKAYISIWRKTSHARCLKREYTRERNFKIRRKILVYYSTEPPYCKCCGETEYKFLSLDHINGGGKKHREKFGRSTEAFYQHVLRDKPDGIQVLCYNCNLSKGFHGECPHQQKTVGVGQ